MQHPLPPPPPYIPSHLKPKNPSPYQILPSKQPKNHPILRQPRRTNPIIWFLATLCLLFSLLLIFFGVATIIIFVSVKPRTPVFDTPAASLSVVYFDSPEFLNGDVTLLANFSNPNKKLEVRFEYAYIELYFGQSLIATQVLQPFSQRPRESKLVPIRLLSSLVYLPPDVAVELQKQGMRNRVVYRVKVSFRVKAKMGLVHYSYWLHGKCKMEMTGPPNGVMLRHSCRTKR